MPLFNRPNGQLQWSDIGPLLAERVPEHEMLEYKSHRLKQDRPIEKTIAAMGNTYGGDIIIGVAEETDGIPVLLDKIEGLTSADAARFKQSIEQKNWKIRPPILGLSVEPLTIPPDVISGRDDRSLVVVRVPQSDFVPHFIPGMGHYGRASSHNRTMEDVDLATDRILWLHDRRRAHVDFRNELLSWMDWQKDLVAWHTVWCVPEFPSPDRPLWERASFEQVSDSIPRVSTPGCDDPFFALDLAEGFSVRSLQHGWLWSADSSTRAEYIHVKRGPVPTKASVTYLVDDRGLVAAKALTNAELDNGIRRSSEHAFVGHICFDWSIITMHLLGVCQHAARLYENRYWGPVQLGVELALNDESDSLDAHLGYRHVRGVSGTLILGHTGLSALPNSESMASSHGRVREVRSCLSGQLLAAARQFACDSHWGRAFNTDFAKPDMTEQVDLIRGLLTS